MEQTDQVLKQDAAGRVWTPRARREAVLDEFERSGLPAIKFAAHIGVKYPTFCGVGPKAPQESRWWKRGGRRGACSGSVGGSECWGRASRRGSRTGGAFAGRGSS
jgi:sugar phosphate isomerase/epimerase